MASSYPPPTTMAEQAGRPARMVMRRQRWARTPASAASRHVRNLHRQRFIEVWNWWHGQPDGEEGIRAARWYSGWTGNDKPFHGGLDDGRSTPGFGCLDADEAYESYMDFPGRRLRAGKARATTAVAGAARVTIWWYDDAVARHTGLSVKVGLLSLLVVGTVRLSPIRGPNLCCAPCCVSPSRSPICSHVQPSCRALRTTSSRPCSAAW
jgi:hypothetical protein